MQFTTLALATVFAGLAAAAPAASAEGTFELYLSSYTNGDKTCADAAHDANGGVSFVGRDNLGKCLVLPSHSDSVSYRVPAYAQGVKDCTITFYDDSQCTTARTGFAISNGALGCSAASSGPYGAVKVTCPN